MKRISQLFLVGTFSVLAFGTTIASKQNVEVASEPPWRYVYTPCTTPDGQPGTITTCVKNGPRQNPFCPRPNGTSVPPAPVCNPNG